MAQIRPKSRRKWRGASLLTDHAWHEIGRTLGMVAATPTNHAVKNYDG